MIVTLSMYRPKDRLAGKLIRDERKKSCRRWREMSWTVCVLLFHTCVVPSSVYSTASCETSVCHCFAVFNCDVKFSSSQYRIASRCAPKRGGSNGSYRPKPSTFMHSANDGIDSSACCWSRSERSLIGRIFRDSSMLLSERRLLRKLDRPPITALISSRSSVGSVVSEPRCGTGSSRRNRSI